MLSAAPRAGPATPWGRRFAARRNTIGCESRDTMGHAAVCLRVTRCDGRAKPSRQVPCGHSGRQSSWASLLLLKIPVRRRCAPRAVRGRLLAQPTVSSFSESRGAGGPAGGATESSASHVVVEAPGQSSERDLSERRPPRRAPGCARLRGRLSRPRAGPCDVVRVTNLLSAHHATSSASPNRSPTHATSSASPNRSPTDSPDDRTPQIQSMRRATDHCAGGASCCGVAG